MVSAEYIAICEEGNSGGVWHLCGFAIYHALEELFLSNIETLSINSLVPPCDCRKTCTATMPLLEYVSFYKNGTADLGIKMKKFLE